MQDNPFLQTEEIKEAEGNPFAKEEAVPDVKKEEVIEVKKEEVIEVKKEEVIEVKKEEVKQVESKAVAKTSNTGGSTEVVSNQNANLGVKAYTGNDAVAYQDVVTFDTDVKLNIVDKFTLNKDQKSVIAFVLFDGNGAPQLRMSQTYYDEPSKTMFRAPSNKPLLMKVAGKMGEPKVRFATIVLRYLTDNNGNLLRPAQGQKPYDLLAYVFSTDKFPQFKEIHKRWDLKKFDVLLTCSDEKYQKVTIIPAQECLYRANPAMANEIVVEARDMFEKGLNRFLGRQLKDEEILAIVEDGAVGAVGAGAGAVNGGASYNPFAGGGDQAGNAGNSADFSNLVKDPGDVKTEGGNPF